MSALESCAPWSSLKNLPVSEVCSPLTFADLTCNVDKGGSFYDCIDPNRCHITQLPDVYPALRPFYTNFELSFNSLPMVCAAADFMNIMYAIVVGYLLMCFVYIKYPNIIEKPVRFFDKTLGLWNALLSVFSFIGTIRTLPHLMYLLTRENVPLSSTLCAPAQEAFGQGAAGLWVGLFIFSKIPELVDTLYLIMRKKKVSLIQWLHHSTVVILCFTLYSSRSASGLVFASVNYFVHSFMYFYFAMNAWKIRTFNFMAPFITTIQIVQMIVGVLVTSSTAYWKYTGSFCDVTDESFAITGIIYAIYLYLFAEFAVGRYCSRGKGKAVKDE